MPSVQELQKQHEEQQKLLDLINEKVMSLRTSRIIETDSAAIFRIDKQIEELKAHRDEVKQEIKELDKVLGQENQKQGAALEINSSNQASTSEKLYYALLRLNYQTQILSFRQFIERRSAAAFVIHGSEKHGQRWLLNRLVRQHFSDIINDKVVPVRLKRLGRSSDISALWRELAERVGLQTRPSVASPSEVAERVCQWLQTQNVILVFHNVDHMPKSFLPELLHKFWLPLVNKTRDDKSQTSNFQLLMFLIDYTGCVSSWDFAFAETLEPTWNPEVPIRLPMITKFSKKILNNWLGNEVDALPLELIGELDNTVQGILKESNNGIPEDALNEICSLCGCDWDEETQKWLKL